MQRRFRLIPLAAALVLAFSFTLVAGAGPVGSDNQLTTFSPSVTGTECSASAVSYNRSSGTALAVWIAPDSGAPHDGRVKAALIGGDGNLTSAPVSVSTTLDAAGWDDCQPVEVAPGPGGSWLVVWPADNDSRIYGQVLDAAGALSGGNLTLSSNTNYNDIETVTAAWGSASSRYLVTWKANVTSAFPGSAASQQIVGRFVDAAGAGIGEDFRVTNIAAGINNSQDVAYGNGRWIAVGATSSSYHVVGQIVTVDGPSGDVFNLSSTLGSASGTLGPSIRFNQAANAFITVFKKNTVTKKELARLLDANGTPVGSDIEVAAVDGSRPRVASLGASGYLVTWHATDTIYARSLAADGTPQGVTETISSTTSAWRPSVTFVGTAGKAVIAFMGKNTYTNVYAHAWYVTDAVEPIDGTSTVPARAGYCTVAGNTNPNTGKAFAPGSFVDLVIGQPASDPSFKGALPANYLQGLGISCDVPAGYTKTAEKVGYGGSGSSGVYDYYRKG